MSFGRRGIGFSTGIGPFRYGFFSGGSRKKSGGCLALLFWIVIAVLLWKWIS